MQNDMEPLLTLEDRRPEQVRLEFDKDGVGLLAFFGRHQPSSGS